jgi:hypothetical protein
MLRITARAKEIWGPRKTCPKLGCNKISMDIIASKGSSKGT